MPEEPEEGPLPGSLSTALVGAFYVILALIALGLGTTWLDLNLFVWHDRWSTSALLDAALGIGLGLLTVAATLVLEAKTQWARDLSGEFRQILGRLTPMQVMVFALTSSLGEELFFRGFLQQALSDRLFGGETLGWVLGLLISSLIFGLLHVGPDRKKFLPWTVMALVLGVGFGLLYVYTGNLLAPLLAHFTINFFNLLRITGQPPAHDEL